MPDMLTQIGSFLGGNGGKTALTLAGLGSNILGAVDNSRQQSKFNNAQSYLQNIITNPAAYNAAVKQYTQPLNQGLVTTVENTTNANLAERGLGGSAAISQSVLAQALAPYILQNQQNASQALQSSLGQISALRPSGGNGFTDISKLLAQLKLGKPDAATPPSITYPNAGADPLGLNTPPPTLPGNLGMPGFNPADLAAMFNNTGAPPIPTDYAPIW